MARIFLIEDNENLREAVRSYLALDEHEVVEFDRLSGVEGAVRTASPDLMILDAMLPDGDGFLLARRLRRDFEFPIIFMTARSSESDRITGLELGADDYVVKPFSPRELVLRVNAVLRRTGAAQQPGAVPERESWDLNGTELAIDRASHRTAVENREVSLTAAEWKILEYLAARPGLVVARDRLLGESLDYLIAEGSERTVDTHIKNIRAKLGDPAWIETVRGFGYRFSGSRNKR